MSDRWQDFNYAEWKKENDKFDNEGYVSKTREILETKDNLIEAMDEISKLEKPPWKPNVYYDKENDIMEIVLSSDGQEYTKWINHQIALNLSKEDEVLGVKIYDIKKLMD